MTASFLEQMLTIYTHLGMLSRGKFRLSPFHPVIRGLDPPPHPPHLPLARDGRIKSGHDGFSRLSPE